MPDAQLSHFDVAHTLCSNSGRAAIYIALEAAGVQDGDEILVPGFHCPAMIKPALSIGAKIKFYCIGPDLSVDMNDIRRRTTDRTKLILAANYFGFPNRLDDIRRFCDQNRIIFLEDCAHSFVGRHNGRNLGAYGDLSVASLTKFFPVTEGGMLAVNNMALLPRVGNLNDQGKLRNLRQLYLILDNSSYYGRLQNTGRIITVVENIFSWLNRLDKKSGQLGNDKNANIDFLDSFDPGMARTKASALTRYLAARTNRYWMGERRREIFQRYLGAFSNGTTYRPLFRHLPDGVVPFMFPLIVDNLPYIFSQLEDAAIPMQRFGQFLVKLDDELECPVAQNYARTLVQFPCHQDLTDEEISDIFSRLASILGA